MINLSKPLLFVIPVVMFMPAPAGAHDHKCCMPAKKADLQPVKPPECIGQTIDWTNAYCSGSNDAKKLCLEDNLQTVTKKAEIHEYEFKPATKVCFPKPIGFVKQEVLDCNPPITSMCDNP